MGAGVGLGDGLFGVLPAGFGFGGAGFHLADGVVGSLFAGFGLGDGLAGFGFAGFRLAEGLGQVGGAYGAGRVGTGIGVGISISISSRIGIGGGRAGGAGRGPALGGDLGHQVGDGAAGVGVAGVLEDGGDVVEADIGAPGVVVAQPHMAFLVAGFGDEVDGAADGVGVLEFAAEVVEPGGVDEGAEDADVNGGGDVAALPGDGVGEVLLLAGVEVADDGGAQPLGAGRAQAADNERPHSVNIDVQGAADGVPVGIA